VVRKWCEFVVAAPKFPLRKEKDEDYVGVPVTLGKNLFLRECVSETGKGDANTTAKKSGLCCVSGRRMPRGRCG
jgi:hypothetical protein